MANVDMDIAIIGAGVVGLAIATELTKHYKDVFVFEKNKSFGQETSSRNSEVIHGGIHYRPDSLKAKLCIEGKEWIYQLDAAALVPWERLGKLIVAVNEDEIIGLDKIIEKATASGVNDLQIIDADEIRRLEPNIQAVKAIFSPSTGIVDSHALMKYFIRQAKDNFGGIEPIQYNSEVIGIDKIEGGYRITIRHPNNEEESYTTRILINAAGLYSDKIAEIAGINIDGAGYKLHYCKGVYFPVSKHKGKTSHLIYPVPNNTELGIHTVLDLKGNLKLGPNAFYVSEIDYNVDNLDPSLREEFYNSVKGFLPFIELDDLPLKPDMAGIRPQLVSEIGAFHDFVMREESDRGFPGLINLIGTESPGLTASPAIGEYVCGIVKGILPPTKKQ